jgi:hypothetical protein
MTEALYALRDYVALTGDKHTEAYIVDHLAIMTSESHGYLSHNKNLDEVLEELDEQESAIEEEEDEEFGLPAFPWEGMPCTAADMFLIGKKEFTLAGIEMGPSSRYIDETACVLSAASLGPEAYGAAESAFIANVVDGRWIVSRHGSLKP